MATAIFDERLDELMCRFYHGHQEKKKVIDERTKVALIKMEFGIIVAKEEIHESETTLRGIIKARAPHICPECNGSGKGKGKEIFCALCKGEGLTTRVAVEKFHEAAKLAAKQAKPPQIAALTAA